MVGVSQLLKPKKMFYPFNIYKNATPLTALSKALCVYIRHILHIHYIHVVHINAFFLG